MLELKKKHLETCGDPVLTSGGGNEKGLEEAKEEEKQAEEGEKEEKV